MRSSKGIWTFSRIECVLLTSVVLAVGGCLSVPPSTASQEERSSSAASAQPHGVAQDGVFTLPACVASNITQLTRSDDGSSFAYAYYSIEGGLLGNSTKWYVSDGLNTLGPFDQVGALYYAADNRTLVFSAQIKGKWYVYQGNSKKGPFDNISYVYGYSVGNELAYTFQSNGKWFAVSGKDTKGPFNEIRIGPFFTAKDMIAYVVPDGNNLALYIGNQKIGPFQKVWAFTVTDDGKVLFYGIPTGAFGPAGGFYLYEGDTKRAGPFQSVQNALAYNAKDHAFAIATGSPAILQYGNEQLGPYESIVGITFSPDGATLTYSAKSDDKWYLFVGGQKAGPFDDEVGPQFSPDGKSLAFAAKIGSNWNVYVNGMTLGPFEDHGGITFSPDGQILLYGARTSGKWFLYEHSVKNPTNNDEEIAGPFDNSLSGYFSSDGAIIGYWAFTNGNEYSFVLVDGHQCVGGVFNDRLTYVNGEKIVLK